MTVIDQAVFDELRQTTGAEFVGELVQTFLDDAPALIAALRAASASGDAAAFRRAAHSLKSNGTIFGASALAGMARELEHRGLEGLGGEAASRVDRTESEYMQVAQVLRGLVRG